ncbi:MAG: N-methyl-L-tryptophan oxidase [Robiginitomaculum sp.]|nr:MAG: N-methyl-L-tryptophan oxidase [Robiginitomaculum sp.]
MTEHYDVAVIGLGVMGAATLSTLARQGVHAIGLDRFSPPHTRGSSHGQTRMVRVAYAESPVYAPMARRSIHLWRELERRTGTALLTQSGVLYGGPPEGRFMQGVHTAAQRHNIPLMDAPTGSALRHGITLPDDWPAVLEREGGYVLAEEAVQAFLLDAVAHGALVHNDNPSAPPRRNARGFVLKTGSAPVHAEKIIVTAGPWTAHMLPVLAPLLCLQRRVLHWFADPKNCLGEASGFHPFGIETAQNGFLYGFPALDGTGVKVAQHIMDDPLATPDALQPIGTTADMAHIDPLVETHLPLLGGRKAMAACIYTMSPDEHFIIDEVPGQSGIYVGAGFSGHGFKFAPLIGEALAAMAMEQGCDFPYRFFALGRFAT